MDDNKDLITTVKTTIYQRESLSDHVQFLIPEFYQELNLTEYTAILKYITPANIAGSKQLIKDENLYKGHLRYMIPIDNSLTQFPGNISIRIIFEKQADKLYRLNTGETVIEVSPIKQPVIISENADETDSCTAFEVVEF